MKLARPAVCRRQPTTSRAVWGVACGALLLSAGIAHAETDPDARAGIWTLKGSDTKRECRMVLRTDTAGKGMGLAMPPGCRMAVPALKTVQAWSMPDDNTVSFDDARGQPVLSFMVGQAGVLQATDAAGAALTMTKLDPTHMSTDGDGPIVSLNPVTAGFEKAKAAKGKGSVSGVATDIAAASVARAAPVTVAGTAGNYAVLRGDRDTGCMVTLDQSPRGPKGSMRARLAPACRDQGIVIFDPLGWQLQADALVLTARKGHTVALQLDANGVWVKAPADMRGLALKRL